MATNRAPDQYPPLAGRAQRIADLLKRVLPELDDLDILDESPLKGLIPAVRVVAAQYRNQPWAEAAALRTIIRRCLQQFFNWAHESGSTRLQAEAAAVGIYVADEKDWRRQTMTDLARRLGRSRQAMYRLRDEALRQVAYLLIQYRPLPDSP
jgi:hypothetical protein